MLHTIKSITAIAAIFALLLFVVMGAVPVEDAASQPATSPAVLWSFAWISDMHMNASNVDYLAGAMQHIDTKLKPNFVLITGDNNYQPAEPSDPANPESKHLLRQIFLKQFLQNHLKTPYVVIPGDDWPTDFEKVFGPRQFSFDYGGMHFLLLAPDRAYTATRREGLTVFDPPTKKWIQQDLEKNKDKPTLVAIHEPIFPPTFLDSPPLRKIVAAYPNVLAVLQGHLHVDLKYHADGKVYLVAPALGVKPSLAMKFVAVSPSAITIYTIPYNVQQRRFEQRPGALTIDIPKELQGKLTAPASEKFAQEKYDSLPARPQIQDPSLENRKGELLRNMMMNSLTKPK